MSPDVRYTTKPPTAKDILGLTKRYTAEQWTILIKISLVVAAYAGNKLVGVTHAHGNGVDWVVEQYFIQEDYRSQGIGMELRLRMNQLCVDNTSAGGMIWGFTTANTRGFWEKLPETKLARMFVTKKKIPDKTK